MNAKINKRSIKLWGTSVRRKNAAQSANAGHKKNQQTKLLILWVTYQKLDCLRTAGNTTFFHAATAAG